MHGLVAQPPGSVAEEGREVRSGTRRRPDEGSWRWSGILEVSGRLCTADMAQWRCAWLVVVEPCVGSGGGVRKKVRWIGEESQWRRSWVGGVDRALTAGSAPYRSLHAVVATGRSGWGS